MNDLLSNYLPIVLFIGLSGLIGLALLVAPFIIAVRSPDPEKVSAYECGFDAFDDARMKFDARFYLVAILFIIFDIETVFMIPWAVYFRQLSCFVPLVNNACPVGNISFFGLGEMLVFMLILLVGLVYVWKKGALQWD